MIPTRPIKTFDKWFRHHVVIEAPGKQQAGILRTLTSRGLRQGKEHDFLLSHTWAGTEAMYFYFEDIYHANYLCKRYKNKFKVYYELYPVGKGPRENEAIMTNFTMADLESIFGNPLPAKIEFLLRDLKQRNINYFGSRYHMHHAWCRLKWWPEAFVYINTRRRQRRGEDNPHVEMLRWCRDNNVVEYDTHACGMWEFGRANEAMLFKLTFGEDTLPK